MTEQRSKSIDLEFWLLEVASEDYVCLCALSSPNPKFVWACFHLTHHGFSVAEVFDKLWEMRDRGLVELFAKQNGQLTACELAGPSDLLERLKGCIEHNTGISYWYGLTQCGGANYEKIALPNWALFVREEQVSVEYKDGWSVQLTSANKTSIETYLARYDCPHEWRLKSKFRGVRNWKSTYWKSLPEGVEVDVFCYTPPSEVLTEEVTEGISSEPMSEMGPRYFWRQFGYSSDCGKGSPIRRRFIG